MSWRSMAEDGSVLRLDALRFFPYSIFLVDAPDPAFNGWEPTMLATDAYRVL